MVSVFAVWLVIWAAVFFVINALSSVWAEDSVVWATVGITFFSVFAPEESIVFVTAVFFALVSMFAP